MMKKPTCQHKICEGVTNFSRFFQKVCGKKSHNNYNSHCATPTVPHMEELAGACEALAKCWVCSSEDGAKMLMELHPAQHKGCSSGKQT